MCAEGNYSGCLGGLLVGNGRLSRSGLTSPRIIDWLAHFDLADQPTAARLLSEIATVNADELVEGLQAGILPYRLWAETTTDPKPFVDKSPPWLNAGIRR
jgi:hypothetical protein